MIAREEIDIKVGLNVSRVGCSAFSWLKVGSSGELSRLWADLEDVEVALLVKKFPTFYGTRKFSCAA
jgi:hypothetical protein